MKLYLRRLRLALMGKDCLRSSYFDIDQEILDHIERFCDKFGEREEIKDLWKEIKKYRVYEEQTLSVFRNWWTDEQINKALKQEIDQQEKVSKLVWENLFRLWI